MSIVFDKKIINRFVLHEKLIYFNWYGHRTNLKFSANTTSFCVRSIGLRGFPTYVRLNSTLLLRS